MKRRKAKGEARPTLAGIDGEGGGPRAAAFSDGSRVPLEAAGVEVVVVPEPEGFTLLEMRHRGHVVGRHRVWLAVTTAACLSGWLAAESADLGHLHGEGPR